MLTLLLSFDGLFAGFRATLTSKYYHIGADNARASDLPISSNILTDSVTRSHKANYRDRSLANGVSAAPHEQLPRYFTKSGPVDADPRKTKKNGGGKRNWGRSGDEVQDYDYTFTNARRHSNSSTQGIGEFRTKFETTEPEPVFGAALDKTLDVTGIADGSATSKTRSASSSNGDCGIRKLSSN